MICNPSSGKVGGKRVGQEEHLEDAPHLPLVGRGLEEWVFEEIRGGGSFSGVCDEAALYKVVGILTPGSFARRHEASKDIVA